MKSLRYITDAAMTAALALVILLISHYTGLEIEETFPFLIAIPVAIYTMFYGWKKGLIPMIAISSLAVLHNPLHALFFIATSNIVGLIYGNSLHKEHSNTYRLAITIIGSFIVNLLSLWIFSKLLYGYTIYDELKNTINSLFESLKINNSSLSSLIYAISEGLIPSIILILSILEGIVFHIITTMIANRVFKKKINDSSFILNFHIPNVITIVYLIVFVLTISFLNKVLEMDGVLKILWIIGVNIIAVGALFYIFGALLFFLKLSNYKQNRLIYFLACLGCIFIFPLFWLFGIVNSFCNFERKLIKNNLF